MLARGAKRARTQGQLQLFVPLQVSWTGRSDLKTLTHYDVASYTKPVRGRSLWSAFYLNELLMRVLAPWDAHPLVYDDYQVCLANLAQAEDPEPCLRYFEKRLLVHLGYAALLNQTTQGVAIGVDSYYRFVPERGLMPIVGDRVNFRYDYFCREQCVGFAYR